MPSKALLQAIAVTAELTGTQLSEAAARVMATDLAQYPEEQVLRALVRVRREVKGRMAIADVLSRLDDGRPGPEEAWASVPRDETTTVVWTEETIEAWGVAQALIREGEPVAARMAFLEAYRQRLQAARDAGRPVRWHVSQGHDPLCRESVLVQAVEQGKLTAEYVAALLPHAVTPQGKALLADTVKRLTGASA